MSVEKETSIYKVTYKRLPRTEGATFTKYGLEIIVYGCDIGEAEDRLYYTTKDMGLSDESYKIIRIERK